MPPVALRSDELQATPRWASVGYRVCRLRMQGVRLKILCQIQCAQH